MVLSGYPNHHYSLSFRGRGARRNHHERGQLVGAYCGGRIFRSHVPHCPLACSNLLSVIPTATYYGCPEIHVQEKPNWIEHVEEKPN